LSLDIENIHQLKAWQPPQVKSVIGEGILLPETRMVIFGPAKTWKSMLAMHTGFTLAMGLPWFGYLSTEVAVLLIQIELPKAVYRQRAVKYADRNAMYPEHLYFKTDYHLKVDTGFGLAALDRYIDKVKSLAPGKHLVIIIDPLYKILTGHISDARDMQGLLDNIDNMRSKHSCSFIIIHHTRLSQITSTGIVDLGAEEMMGSSYLNNWCDTAIKTKLLNPHTGGNQIELSFELTRHAETILPRYHIDFSRETLRPKIIRTIQPDYYTEDITTKGLVS
jgi:RecA-family ATPase